MEQGKQNNRRNRIVYSEQKVRNNIPGKLLARKHVSSIPEDMDVKVRPFE